MAAWEFTGDTSRPALHKEPLAVRERPPGAAELQVRAMNLTLHVWRQKDASDPGRHGHLPGEAITPDMSFLEMLDVLNEELIRSGGEPIAFEHDCREGICGSCGLMINGEAHGPRRGTADLPAAHAVLPGRRRDRASSPGGRAPSR